MIDLVLFLSPNLVAGFERIRFDQLTVSSGTLVGENADEDFSTSLWYETRKGSGRGRPILARTFSGHDLAFNKSTRNSYSSEARTLSQVHEECDHYYHKNVAINFAVVFQHLKIVQQWRRTCSIPRGESNSIKNYWLVDMHGCLPHSAPYFHHPPLAARLLV